MYLYTDAEAPTNIQVQQNGRNSIEISWTAPANSPSQGYRILSITDVSSLVIPVNSSPFTLQLGGPTLVHIRVVGVSLHFISDVLREYSINLRGENIYITVNI